MRRIYPIFLFFFAFWPNSSHASLAIVDAGLEAGYVSLGWHNAAGNSFVLKQKTGSRWRNIYKGPDRATTLTGLMDGDYNFALYNKGGKLIGSKTVAIRHHSLARAGAFFSVGAVLFVILTTLLFRNPPTEEQVSP